MDNPEYILITNRNKLFFGLLTQYLFYYLQLIWFMFTCLNNILSK